MRRRALAVAAVILVAAIAVVTLLRAPLSAHAAQAARIQSGSHSHSHTSTMTMGTGAASRSCSLQYRWSVVPSSNLPVQAGDGNYLSGMTAITPNDAWAVGYAGVNGYGVALAEHWDGTAWSLQQPTISAPSSELAAVAADTSNDVWTVGSYYPVANVGLVYPVAARRNGSSWSVYKLTSSSAIANAQFFAVTALSPTNVWAVGQDDLAGTLVEHWDGTSWTTITTPALSNGGYFNNVTALGTNDIWAVGAASTSGSYRTLVEHWNGTAWSIVASPNPGSAYDVLSGIVAFSDTSIWVADQQEATVGGPYSSLMLRWNGSTWSNVTTAPDIMGIFRVVAFSPSSIWFLNGVRAVY